MTSRRRIIPILLAAALLCLTGGSITTAAAAPPMALGSSTQIPAAQGEARIRTTRNGNTEIRLSVRHLAPPDRIVPGADVFVVWVRGLAATDEAQNVGALKVDRNLGAKLTLVTPLTSFDLFITCEQSQTAQVPASLELLPLHVSPR